MQATHAKNLSVNCQLAERKIMRRRAQNKQAPISRLYPEIFSIIFCQVRKGSMGYVQDDWFPNSPAEEVIGLTHVCHTWRVIALNNPTLWATMYVSLGYELERVQVLLQRSKQCPLSIIVGAPRSKALASVDPVLQELKNHMPRCRHLNLQHIPVHDLYNFFSNFHPHRLQHLYIDAPYSSRDVETSSETSSSDESSEVFTLDDGLLRVDSLEHLRVVRCGLDFEAVFLHSLTHLELCDIDKNCRLPCSDFVAILAKIPALEALDLTGFLEEDEIDEIDDMEEYVSMTNRTRLHHLKNLYLSCRTTEMAQFLCSLILPPTCKLDLRIFDEADAINPGFPFVCKWISNHFQPPTSSSVDGETSFQNYFRSFYIEDSSDGIEIMGLFETSKNEAKDKPLFVFSIWEPFEDGEDFYRLLLASLPLGNIVSLEVLDHLEIMLDSLWEFFAPLTHLKTITIECDGYCSFFDSAAERAQQNSTGLTFPALSSVSVKASRVKPGDYRSFYSCLDSRKQVGLPPFDIDFHPN